MQAFLRALLPYADDFAPPQDGDPEAPTSFFWNNPAFSYSDAMAYYCILRHLRPRRVIEVGSGFSTLVAAQALRDNCTRAEDGDSIGRILCVEPFPMPFLRRIPEISNLREERAQDVPASFFAETLEAGDVLFIDSTHVVKTGSD